MCVGFENLGLASYNIHFFLIVLMILDGVGDMLGVLVSKID